MSDALQQIIASVRASSTPLAENCPSIILQTPDTMLDLFEIP